MDLITYALCRKLIKRSIESLGDIFTLKGNVDSVENLPSTGNKTGDVYLVGPDLEGSYDEYYWTSENEWEIMGTTGPGFEHAITEETMYKGTDGTGTIENPAQDTIMYVINNNINNMNNIYEGYYYNDKFYEDANHTIEITGESGKFYVDLSTNTTYRWDGTEYTKIAGDSVKINIKEPFDHNIETNSINLYDAYVELSQRKDYILAHPQLMLNSTVWFEPEQGSPLENITWGTFLQNYEFPASEKETIEKAYLNWFKQIRMEKWEQIYNIYTQGDYDVLSNPQTDLVFTINGQNYDCNYILTAIKEGQNSLLLLLLPYQNDWWLCPIETGSGEYQTGIWKKWTPLEPIDENIPALNVLIDDRIAYLSNKNNNFSNTITTWEENINTYFPITDWIEINKDLFGENFYNLYIFNEEEIPKYYPEKNFQGENNKNLNWIFDMTIEDNFGMVNSGLFLVDNKVYYYNNNNNNHNNCSVYPPMNTNLEILSFEPDCAIFADENNTIKKYRFLNQNDLEGKYVKITGDTMTGSLFIDAAEAYDLIKDKDRIGLAIGHPSHTKSLGAASVAISSADIVTDPNPETYGETWYDCYALGDGSVAMGKNIFALGKSSFAQGAADSRSIYLKGEANATVYKAVYSWSFFPVDEHTYLMENNKIVAKVLSCNADPEQSAIAVVTVDKTLDENNAFNNRLFKVIYLSTKGEYSHAEGYGTCAEDRYSHAEGYKSVSSGQASHAEGDESTSSGTYSHAEGKRTDSIGEGSHTEGYYTEAQKSYSHAEGCFTRTKGYYAHAEGGVSSDPFALQLTGEGNATTYTTTNTKGARIGDQVASSNYQMDGYWGNAIVTAVVENESITFNRTLSSSAISNKTYYLFYTVQAEGKISHAEGGGTRAIGQGSHTEGQETIALKNYSHAEGFGSKTDGKYAHAEGIYTIANGEGQHTEGKFNIADVTSLHIIGNGTAENARSNAHTLDASGNAWFSGDVYVNSTSGTNKDEGSKKLPADPITNEFIYEITNAVTIREASIFDPE